MNRRTFVEVRKGVRVYSASMWQTNCVLVETDAALVLVDPSFSESELCDLRADVERVQDGRPMWICISHGDYDHICGIQFFPQAKVLVGEETAMRILSGRAAKEMAEATQEWGTGWSVPKPRVDAIIEPGQRMSLGGLRITTIDTRGHECDGLAYLLEDSGVLIVGDYLTSESTPVLMESLDGFDDSLQRLRAVLEAGDVNTVVPGHGPILDLATAQAVLEADQRYLRELREAADAAVGRGLAPGVALVEVYGSVQRPRQNVPGFSIWGVHARSATKAIDEALDRSLANKLRQLRLCGSDADENK